jgi:anti-sigma regulatory factor (Ser/Thr protein kinase)
MSGNHSRRPDVPAPAPQDDTTVVYEREVPARPDDVARVRHELDDVLAGLGVEEDRRADVALVVSEAGTNAVRHAYADRGEGPVDVRAAQQGERLVVTVADGGCGLGQAPASSSLGCGLHLMEEVADDLRVESAPPAGTQVTAVFAAAARPPVVPGGEGARAAD